MTRHAATVASPCLCKSHPEPAPAVEAPGSANVMIRGKAAARVGDGCLCAGAPNEVVTGNPRVTVNGRPIAREFDFLTHGAIIRKIQSTGRDVVVGVPALTPSGEAVPMPPECAFLRQENIDDADTMKPLPHERFAKYGKPFAMGPQTRAVHVNRNSGKPTPASVTVVTVDGKQIRVAREDGPIPPGTVLPSDAEVATSLSRLPKNQLEGIDTVVVTPARRTNKDGSPLATPADYKDREVYIYPRGPTVAGRPRTQGDLDWQLTHELAHGHDAQTMVDDAAWNEAVAGDRKFPSRYARETYARGGGTGEDYAESLVLYALVRGTPCEAPARQMYPHRFALLDRYHGSSYR